MLEDLDTALSRAISEFVVDGGPAYKRTADSCRDLRKQVLATLQRPPDSDLEAK